MSERQRTLRLTVDLTYDAHLMHDVDASGIEWFHENVLGGPLELWSGEIGDTVGDVSVVEIAPPEPRCIVCSGPAQPKLTINLEPVCADCVRSGRAFNKEEA